MKVLVTGAFGNIGTNTVRELLAQGHLVRCFDLKTKANERAAKRFGGLAEVVWGDLRKPEDLAEAVKDQDVVIHLAFIIPSLSATGVDSEKEPEWARAINVGGTGNLLEAIKAQCKPARIVFASSMHVYGRTQHLAPPRQVSDPLVATEHYSHHKIECERMVRASGLKWCILRLAATLPISMKMDAAMFEVPLDNRMEYCHTRDVGLAFANAASSPHVWGKVMHVGGGPRCQHYYREIAQAVLNGLGVGMLPEKAFTKVPFATDWLDTEESERLLRYQRHTLKDYVRDMQRALGVRRHLAKLFRPIVRAMLLSKSAVLHPNGRTGGRGGLTTAKQGLKAPKRRPTHVRIG
ncbi:MAG TPA: NAD(P)-dependent oxidoreductase [Anaerolineae bacterium]|nr:NAD(P)-dependent oxidoreductase [Anaerolineae bacterium]